MQLNVYKVPLKANLCTQKKKVSWQERKKKKIIWKCRTKIWPRKPTISFCVFVCAYVIDKISSHSLLQGYSILMYDFFFIIFICIVKSYDDHLEDFFSANSFSMTLPYPIWMCAICWLCLLNFFFHILHTILVCGM